MDNNLNLEILKTLREILQITRFVTFNDVRDDLLSILDSDEARVIYDLSDGRVGVREIAEKTKLITGKGSLSMVSEFWNTWAKCGIVTRHGKVQGRMVKVFNLEKYEVEIKKKNES